MHLLNLRGLDVSLILFSEYFQDNHFLKSGSEITLEKQCKFPTLFNEGKWWASTNLPQGWKSNYFLQRHDGPFAPETPACPEWKEIRMCWEGISQGACAYLFVSLIMFNWKKKTRSFSKTHKWKNWMWLYKLKTDPEYWVGNVLGVSWMSKK